MILPHRQVQGYTEFKAENPEKWLSGMRKFQDRLFIDELPGDLMRDFSLGVDMGNKKTRIRTSTVKRPQRMALRIRSLLSPMKLKQLLNMMGLSC